MMFGGLKEKDLTVLSHLGRYFPTKKCEEFFFFLEGEHIINFQIMKLDLKEKLCP